MSDLDLSNWELANHAVNGFSACIDWLVDCFLIHRTLNIIISDWGDQVDALSDVNFLGCAGIYFHHCIQQ